MEAVGSSAFLRIIRPAMHCSSRRPAFRLGRRRDGAQSCGRPQRAAPTALSGRRLVRCPVRQVLRSVPHTTVDAPRNTGSRELTLHAAWQQSDLRRCAAGLEKQRPKNYANRDLHRRRLIGQRYYSMTNATVPHHSIARPRNEGRLAARG